MHPSTPDATPAFGHPQSGDVPAAADQVIVDPVPAAQGVHRAAAEGVAGSTRSAGAWVRALILILAVMVIGVFVWLAASRVGGRELWVVKFSVVAWLVGMGTASAVLAGAQRSGAGAKVVAALAAVLTIVIAKLMDGLLSDGAAAGSAFGAVDLLLFALAIGGSAMRFMLARPEA